MNLTQMILDECKLNQHENPYGSGALARKRNYFFPLPPLMDTGVSLKCAACLGKFSGADTDFIYK